MGKHGVPLSQCHAAFSKLPSTRLDPPATQNIRYNVRYHLFDLLFWGGGGVGGGGGVRLGRGIMDQLYDPYMVIMSRLGPRLLHPCVPLCRALGFTPAKAHRALGSGSLM